MITAMNSSRRGEQYVRSNRPNNTNKLHVQVCVSGKNLEQEAVEVLGGQ